MPRVEVNRTEAAFIAERIRLFADEAPETLRWQVKYTRTHQGLPLYVGWTATLALRADGELIMWSTEESWPVAREITEQLTALAC